MPTNLVVMLNTQRCRVCEAETGGGTLTFTAEVRNGPDHWTGVSTVDHVRLCETDYDRFTRCADTITAGDSGAAILGLPLRGSKASLGPGHCDCCQCELTDQATTLEFVPLAQVYLGRSRSRRDGALRRLRLCNLCLSWWRTTIAHPLTLLGVGTRRLEGPPGGWLNLGHGDAATLGLLPRDVAIVATTMEADGADHRAVHRKFQPSPTEMLFVAAGKASRAATFVRGVEPSVRRRIAVVALMDHLADAAEALQAGASELLATPLSPQQVVGAFARVNAPVRPPKDTSTGLPILTGAAHAVGGSCLAFSVATKTTRQLLESALLARRALRGYDAVGTDGNGNLLMYVYAEAVNQERIRSRLKLVFGKGADVLSPPVASARAA